MTDLGQKVQKKNGQNMTEQHTESSREKISDSSHEIPKRLIDHLLHQCVHIFRLECMQVRHLGLQNSQQASKKAADSRLFA